MFIVKSRTNEVVEELRGEYQLNETCEGKLRKAQREV